MNYNGAYYYLRNGQGDIVGLLDSTGATVVSYTYDAWGKPLTTTGTLATTLGQDNPFRYRGYLYDTETGLYYLKSRYYDPDTCRFLNGDVLMSTGQGVIGYNMYGYCNNNCIALSDTMGSIPSFLRLEDDGGGGLAPADATESQYNTIYRLAHLLGKDVRKEWNTRKDIRFDLGFVRSEISKTDGFYVRTGSSNLVVGTEDGFFLGMSSYSGDYFSSLVYSSEANSWSYEIGWGNDSIGISSFVKDGFKGVSLDKTTYAGHAYTRMSSRISFNILEIAVATLATYVGAQYYPSMIPNYINILQN